MFLKSGPCNRILPLKSSPKKGKKETLSGVVALNCRERETRVLK
jgi:hypothetical protein